MPEADELFGGFWSVCPSPVIDDLAAAYTVLSDAAVAQRTAPARKTFTVRADQASAAYAADGRPLTAFPGPPDDPAWISGPSAETGPIWCRGLDYDVVDGDVLFEVNPFDVLDAVNAWVDGEPVATVTLWYGRSADPTEPETYAAGTHAALVAAVAAACDSPAASATETVEAVFEGDDGFRVVTDLAVYRLGADDEPSVDAGDELDFGDPVGSAWTLTRLGPAAPDLTHVTTPASFHQGATTGAITWFNAVLPLTVDTSFGRTRVRFRLGAASQTDYDDFWSASHTNGVANDLTLAQALDTRTDPTTEPTTESLPAFVNPMELLCRELLAGNAWQLVVFPDRFGPDAVAAATRTRTVTVAAGPYTTVFEFEDEVPALDPYDPTESSAYMPDSYFTESYTPNPYFP